MARKKGQVGAQHDPGLRVQALNMFDHGIHPTVIKSLLKLESMPLLYTQFVGVLLLEAGSLTKDLLLCSNILKILDGQDGPKRQLQRLFRRLSTLLLKTLKVGIQLVTE
jgi:hypothetical protein